MPVGGGPWGQATSAWGAIIMSRRAQGLKAEEWRAQAPWAAITHGRAGAEGVFC